ncbi:hypothetical protein SEA_ZARTROSA_77 [Arthrobacter phage Zartrosa]|uniref:Uncharacterized protein n=1 Tax=Arthrobacter phage Zartrosa TaxID=2603257 RepID=A0A5B8WGX4_9CAUD|nr:hypothetical protein HYP98_gp77 [Arthrobacter phage Zartrosa]QED11189.1 hypothetical protein SEA_ZARTROSA_77 [Arthrobacter phage Zartrosa]
MRLSSDQNGRGVRECAPLFLCAEKRTQRLLSNKYRRENAFSLVRHTEPAARLANEPRSCP